MTDAAERLRTYLRKHMGTREFEDGLIDEALAAERRAAVERIRAALEARHQNARAMYPLEIHAILDAEADVPKRDERHQILDDLFPVDR